MFTPLPCGDEATRIRVLRSYDILDTPPEERFDNLVMLAQLVAGVPMAAVSLIDENRLWLKSKIGLNCTELPRSVTFCQYTIETQGPVVVPDATTDVRFQDNPLVTGDPNVRFYAGLPLLTREDAILGALFVFDTVARPGLNPTEFSSLYALSRIVVDAIELRSLATYDSLTRVLANGPFRQAAKRRLDHRNRYDRTFSIIALDIDHFKRVNDTYGHAAGDVVLREVASMLRSEARSSDLVGRIGGEEFAFALPETSGDTALELAERLRARLSERILSTGSGPMRVTASLGIAESRQTDRSFEDTLARADQALYRSKQSGRNRVTSFNELILQQPAYSAA